MHISHMHEAISSRILILLLKLPPIYRNRMQTKKNILCVWLGLVLIMTMLASNVFAVQQIKMEVGQSQRLKLSTTANRINVGKTGILSLTMPDPMTLSMKAWTPGVTTLQVWYTNNTYENILVIVSEVNQSGLDSVANYLSDKLKDLKLSVVVTPKLSATDVQKVLISGETSKINQGYYEDSIAMFTDMIDSQVTFVTPKPAITAKAEAEKVATAVKLAEAEVKTKAKAEKPQLVQIDVSILDVSLSRAKDLGVAWFANNTSIGLSPSGSSTPNSSFTLTGIKDNFNGSTILGFNIMSAQLRALIDNGCATILAAPKLTVKSGEKASFLAGGEVPIVSTTANTSSVTYRKFGTQLDITPKILEGNLINVLVKSSFSQIDNTIAVNGNPGFTRKDASTELTIQSGLTFALAGFVQRNKSDTVSRLPVLGCLPVFGQAFRKNISSVEEKETLILITPHVLCEQTGCFKEAWIGSRYAYAEENQLEQEDSLGLNEFCDRHHHRELMETPEGEPVYDSEFCMPSDCNPLSLFDDEGYYYCE